MRKIKRMLVIIISFIIAVTVVGLIIISKEKCLQISFSHPLSEAERNTYNNKEVQIKGFLNVNTTIDGGTGILSMSPVQTDIGYYQTDDSFMDSMYFILKDGEDVRWGAKLLVISGTFINVPITDSQGMEYHYYIKDATIKEDSVNKHSSYELKRYTALIDSGILSEFDNLMTYYHDNMVEPFDKEIELYAFDKNRVSEYIRMMDNYGAEDDAELIKETLKETMDIGLAYNTCVRNEDTLGAKKISDSIIEHYQSVYSQFVQSVIAE